MPGPFVDAILSASSSSPSEPQPTAEELRPPRGDSSAPRDAYVARHRYSISPLYDEWQKQLASQPQH